MRFALHHRVYNGKTVPLGALDAERNVSPQIIQQIDELLGSIRPATTAPAYAVKRFIPAEGGSIVCLIVSHAAADTRDRPAAINHARILRIDSAGQWLDAQALVGLATQFAPDVGDIETLRAHLESAERGVDVEPWTTDTFKDVPVALARAVVEICLPRANREGEIVSVDDVPTASAALPSVAAAWSALPLVIQRSAAFAIDALKGAKVNVLFTTAAHEPPPVISEATRKFASAYVGWVRNHPGEVQEFIVNPAIRDAPSLSAEFNRVSGAPPVQREEEVMAKNKRAVEPIRGGADAALAVEIAQQVKAAETSLREYIDKHLEAVDALAKKQAARAGGGGGGASVAGRPLSEAALGLIAAAVVGALAALLVVWLMAPKSNVPQSQQQQQEQQDTAASAATTTTAAPAATDTSPRVPTPAADAIPGEDWSHRFLWLNANQPRRLATIVKTLAPGAVVPAAITKNIREINADLTAGKALDTENRQLLRGILFQLVARDVSGKNVPIDGKFASVPAAVIKTVRERFALESKHGTDTEKANFEAEAILRWAAQKEL